MQLFAPFVFWVLDCVKSEFLPIKLWQQNKEILTGLVKTASSQVSKEISHLVRYKRSHQLI